MEQEQLPQGYEKPEIIDYGTLVELTASQHHHRHEDGLGKNADEHPHHSHPHR
jgi:hypothetical protein